MARRGITALRLATLLSAGGCYDSHFSEAAGGAAAGEGNTPLSELRARYTGRPTLVEEDIRVVGYVTTSDRAGNFYRTLCIEQAGAALEVMVGLDHLHNDYPPGNRLMVRLRGLTLGLQYGVLQAGTRAEPGSGYATGYQKVRSYNNSSGIFTKWMIHYFDNPFIYNRVKNWFIIRVHTFEIRIILKTYYRI